MMPPRQNIHSAEEISRIRVACRLTDQVRQQLAAMIKPGMSTFDVDMLAGELIQKSGGKSAFKGYYGYPGNICISVNNEVVHGIGRPLTVVKQPRRQLQQNLRLGVAAHRAEHRPQPLIVGGHGRHQGGRAGVYDIEVKNDKDQLIAVFRGRSSRIKGHFFEEA